MFKIITSNENKIKEFARYSGSEVFPIKGKDLKEVDSSPLIVIIHKSIEAGKDFVVEDTSLFVGSTDIGANIRWFIEQGKMDSIIGEKAVWKVMLGYNDGKTISVFEAEMQGTIVQGNTEGFGFDSYFLPDGSDKTLEELGEEKDKFSARKKAVDKMLKGDFLYREEITSIPKWTGEYQNTQGGE